MDKRSGAERIADERRRQIEREGWGEAHDDEHTGGQLAQAAAIYATPRHWLAYRVGERAPIGWPWADEWWRPSRSSVRDLEKAGALIAAEIDRLLRLENDARPVGSEKGEG